MCWQCDHPRATRRDYLETLRDLVEDAGWAVQGVQRDGVHPPWAYTIGLTPAGRPELVVTGMPLSRAIDLLNDVAEHVLHADAPPPGEQIALTGGPLIEIVELAEPAAHLRNAVEFYGTAIRALQLVHADDRGHWPWGGRLPGRSRRSARSRRAGGSGRLTGPLLRDDRPGRCRRPGRIALPVVTCGLAAGTFPWRAAGSACGSAP